MPDASLRPHPAIAGLLLLSKPSHATVADAGPASRFVYRGAPDVLRDVFGPRLPVTPCRAAVAGDHAALWLGPDEWLLIAPDKDAGRLASQIRGTLAERGCLVDVSHRGAGLIVQGPRAADLLNAACPLDLDTAAFPIDMCARTIFGKAEIVLWRKDNATFHLEAWRSFLPYVVGLFAVAQTRDLAP